MCYYRILARLLSSWDPYKKIVEVQMEMNALLPEASDRMDQHFGKNSGWGGRPELVMLSSGAETQELMVPKKNQNVQICILKIH